MIRELKQTKEGIPPRGDSRGGRAGPYPFETRRKAVRLCLEEGFPAELVAQEVGADKSSIQNWIGRYQKYGEAGLHRMRLADPLKARSTSSAVKQKITQIKQEHPTFGAQKISQFLRRFFLLGASRETVRKTLHEKHLIQKSKKKPKRNPSKPRFFERSTPNQLWQSDIFPFRLNEKYAYLIGFIDDYSRYIVGLDVFRSQTTENLLEVYRTAVGEYGIPREVLTDQGRQYASWRGKTKFQQELQKDRVHHILSRPHHPMTLGKIERFWKTIWEDFLERAKFESLESARDRIRCWVKYYNHKRPHQSLEGLCPADRFFEIQKGLREAIEKGVQENTLELALHGEPKSPFYMVGRIGAQSVVFREEKGQVKMLIAGEPKHDDGNESERAAGVQCPAEVPGGVVGVDEAPKTGPGVPGAVDPLGDAASLAEPGAGGYAGEPRTAEPQAGGADSGLGAEAAADADAEGAAAGRQALQAGPAVEQDPGGEPGSGNAEACRLIDGGRGHGTGQPGATPGGTDHTGAERPDHGHGSGPAAGGLPEDLLQVGKPGACGDGGGAGRPGGRAADAAAGSGEGPAPGGESVLTGPAQGPGANQLHPGVAG